MIVTIVMKRYDVFSFYSSESSKHKCMCKRKKKPRIEEGRIIHQICFVVDKHYNRQMKNEQDTRKRTYVYIYLFI